RQQLCPCPGGARARERRLCARQRLEPEHGTVQHLLHQHAGADGAGVLHRGELSV
ncbi:hypothetical protein LTR94_035915, partial [Friedmanniomyces endolithicus]